MYYSMVNKNTTTWGFIIVEEGDFVATFGVKKTHVRPSEASKFRVGCLIIDPVLA